MVSGWSFPHSMGIPKNLPSDGARGRSSPRLAAMKTVLIFQALWKSHQVFHENCLKLGPQIDEFTRKVHWDDPIWPNSWMCSCSRYLINSLELGTSSGDCHCKYIVPTFIWVSIMNCLKNHSPHNKKCHVVSGIPHLHSLVQIIFHCISIISLSIIHEISTYISRISSMIIPHGFGVWDFRYLWSGELWSIKGGACWDSMSGLLGFNDKTF